MLTYRGGTFLWTMDSGGRGATAHFIYSTATSDRVDVETKLSGGTLINGRRYSVIVTLRDGRAVAYVDGRMINDLRGDPSHMTRSAMSRAARSAAGMESTVIGLLT